MSAPIIVGICGGSGSGKSWLARELLNRLPPGAAAIIEQDWYYRDLSSLPHAEAEQTNFDHPDSLELDLLEEHLRQLASGAAVQAPRYEFSRFARAPETVTLLPAPVIFVEGLFILQPPSLRRLLDLSIFIEAPSDIRLIRRLRRDIAERGYALHQILDFWENRAHPMHERFVEPQRIHATRLWKSMQDSAFVPEILADLTERLSRNAPTPPR